MPERKAIKVVSLNHTDYFGGAAKATYRLCEGLNSIGINSILICNKKTSINKNIFEINKLYNNIDKTIIFIKRVWKYSLHKLFKTREIYLNDCSEIKDSILYGVLNRMDFDILHLNWVVGGFVNFLDLKNISKPIVATLHDSSFFTGVCHVIDNCDNYKEECGFCPRLNSSEKKDLSYETYLLKKERYKALNLTFVSPSNWMAKKAKSSSLLKNYRIEVIPNGIDTNLYSPLEKKLAKQKLNLDSDKRYITFGAVSLLDENKGYKYITELLQKFKLESDIEFLTFGESATQVETQNIIRQLGYIKDEELLVQIYSASEIVIVPSVQESFGQTALESLSCGTPVVAFKTSGLTDIIDHKINGYLANPFDITDLYNGIDWCLNGDRESICYNARNKAVSNFDVKIVAKKYADLFRELT
ncbi:MAG: glycosyltransferase [Bacteroidota bacterium]|nr:glycosyltransferase [Bacteroidota bacterium]MDP3144349.1 glycosyltransferase [Bacteroidota bacterium]